MYRPSQLAKILPFISHKVEMSFPLGELTNSPHHLVAQNQVGVADLRIFIFYFALRCKTYKEYPISTSFSYYYHHHLHNHLPAGLETAGSSPVKPSSGFGPIPAASLQSPEALGRERDPPPQLPPCQGCLLSCPVPIPPSVPHVLEKKPP